MKTRYKIIIPTCIVLFLIVAVVYPTINYKTWGNNELSYALAPSGTKIICDEWLWQPPQNCRITPYLQTHDESLSIKFSPLNVNNVEFSLTWCTKNNGLWDADDSTCYFKNKDDLDKGAIALQQHAERVSGE